MLTFIAILFFVVGFLNIFAKDLMWNLTSVGGPLEGLPTEHNASWDRWATLCGVLSIIVGLVFWFYA